GLLAGLGTGAASAGRAGAAAAATSATVPEPTVTTVARPTNAARNLPGVNRPPVHLGDMNTPEEFIIGQLYQLALQQQGYTVSLDRNISAPYLRIAGLRTGTLDLYPEYIGEWNSRVAHLHRRYRSLHAAYMAGAAYARRHGFRLLPPTPYSHTYCVAVLSQYAAANHLRSIPALARSAPIIFGAPKTFQDISDGLRVLERGYHLRPGYVQTILDTLQYWWLGSGNVQAASCNTTDPQLASPKFVELRDPRHVFGYGNVIPVTTARVLRAEGPAFTRTIERVDRLLTLRAVRGLNTELELGGHLPTNIAAQFLQGNGILPPSRYAPVPGGGATTGAGTAPS
ncbi:MAG: hypothetical protein KGL16_07180, partial [Acidobacteriota bacterium]|nr:hypothetical protein [Acidobacteriota bacterium]